MIYHYNKYHRMANLLESASRNKARKNGKERKLKNIYFRSVINMLSLNFPSYISANTAITFF